MISHISCIPIYVTQSLIAISVLLAAEASSFDSWIIMIERLGIAVALVAFFVYTGWKREQRMAKRLDWLEIENDKLSVTTTTMTEKVTASITESNKVISKALDTLASRMCWACSTRDQFEKIKTLVDVISDDKLQEILHQIKIKKEEEEREENDKKKDVADGSSRSSSISDTCSADL